MFVIISGSIVFVDIILLYKKIDRFIKLNKIFHSPMNYFVILWFDWNDLIVDDLIVDFFLM